MKFKFIFVIITCFIFNIPKLVAKSLPPKFDTIKTIDGIETNCDAYNEANLNTHRPIGFKILTHSKKGDTYYYEMSLNFLVCKNNEWTVNYENSIDYSYKDSIGQELNESLSFKDFKVILKSPDQKIIETIALNTEAKQPTVFKFQIKKNKLKYINLILTAEQLKKNPADQEVKPVIWGSFKVELSP